jgi:3'-5' exoribonuclease
MKKLTVAEIATKKDREEVKDLFLVSFLQERSDKNGKPFLVLTLGDKTGQVEARMWDASASSVVVSQGDVAEVSASVESYLGRQQLKVNRIQRANSASYSIADFLPATTLSVDDLWAKLISVVASFEDKNLQALLNSILQDASIAPALREAPAAKQLHHAWIGGLLEHIVSLLGLAEGVTNHYRDLNRDLVCTGVILHDIGKLQELSWRRSFEYTLEGQLLGHIQMGFSLVERHIATLPSFPPRLRQLVLHMILSHHGKLEFGSPKLPMFPEAVVLSFLDDLDAKMQAMRTELERWITAGRKSAELTDKIWSLDNRAILNTKAYLSGEGDDS